MRRKDREITDKSMIDEFLAREKIMRVAFYGTRAGRKFEPTKAEPTVGFEIDGGYKLSESEKPVIFR